METTCPIRSPCKTRDGLGVTLSRSFGMATRSPSRRLPAVIWSVDSKNFWRWNSCSVLSTTMRVSKPFSIHPRPPTARSVRRAGVNSGSKRLAEPGGFRNPMRSDAAPPVLTASLGSHASQSRTPASNPILKLRFLQCSRQKNLLISSRRTSSATTSPGSPNPPEANNTVAHSITSSARATRVYGKLRPIVRAALRLIDSVNLSGACTGRSAGRCPRRMRST